MVVDTCPEALRVGVRGVVGHRWNRSSRRDLLDEQHGIPGAAPQLREHYNLGVRVVLRREDDVELVVGPVPDARLPVFFNPRRQRGQRLVAPHVSVPRVARARPGRGVRVVRAVGECRVDARASPAAHAPRAVQRRPWARRRVHRMARDDYVVLEPQFEPPVHVLDDDLVG